MQNCIDIDSSSMAEEHYQAGNSLFRSSDYSDAILEYNVALNLVDIDNELKVRILLNISQCHIQLRDTSAALASLNEILKIDERNIKALIRLALVYETIGDYKCGLSIIEKVLVMPTPPQLLETSLKLRSRLKQLLLQDTSIIKQEICPDHFVTSQQTLRLNFILPPPCDYINNSMFTIKLCITNEFGLWNRRHNMPPKDSNDIHGTDTNSLIQNQENKHSLQLFCEIIFLLDGNTKGNDSRNILPLTIPAVYFGEDGKAETNISIHSPTISTITPPPPLLATSLLIPKENGIEIALLHCYCKGKLSSGASVIDIYSLPIRICSSSSNIDTTTTTTTTATDDVVSSNSNFEYHSLEKIYKQLSTLSSKVDAQSIRSMHISDMQFLAFESPGYLGIAGKVWDSSYVLLKYLSNNSHLITNKFVIELGSGTGLAGFALSTLSPAHVILTDYPNVIPLITANQLLNRFVSTDPTIRHTLQYSYSANGYIWGKDSSLDFLYDQKQLLQHQQRSQEQQQQQQQQFEDISLCILASDVVYDPNGYIPFLESLESILKFWNHNYNNNNNSNDNSYSSTNNIEDLSPLGISEVNQQQRGGVKNSNTKNAICILAHRHRHPEDSKFFELIQHSEYLKIEEIFHNDGINNSTENSSVNVQQDNFIENVPVPIADSVLSDVRLFYIYGKF